MNAIAIAAATACAALLTAVGQESNLLQHAPAKTAGTRNPLESNPGAERAGAKLFARECAACHGAGGEGRRRAPALNVQRVREAPPGAVFWVLRNGSLWHGMPSFAHLPEAQRWQIIAFLQRRR